MAPRVHIEDQRYVARLFVQGGPQREITQRTGRLKKVFARIIHAFREDGPLEDDKWSRRPRVKTHATNILIVATAVVDLFLSAKKIRDELSSNKYYYKGSEPTTEGDRGLQFAGLQKPFLSERQRQQHLDFVFNQQN
ncbi:hypothetical protein HPB51_006989 [Rhipicephalus microplus]|uniref:Tick transposon n=1 Tax=Rhipicephalus microplus TaxID=6941 RepID=A0A9J6D928_RHIMP|nr:hypothetical protein HPB51_006989 [Rhipicephalus microplus]